MSSATVFAAAGWLRAGKAENVYKGLRLAGVSTISRLVSARSYLVTPTAVRPLSSSLPVVRHRCAFSVTVRALAPRAGSSADVTKHETTKKARPKNKAAPQKKVAPKKKAASTEKAAKKAVKKAAPKKKKVADEYLAPDQLERRKKRARQLKIRELRVRALVGQQPETLVTVVWCLFLKEYLKKEGRVEPGAPNRLTPGLGDAFKALPQSELERLQLLAKENKAANQAAMKAWLESHTVASIRQANQARSQLKKLGAHIRSNKLRRIVDPRMPKMPRSSFAHFAHDRLPQLTGTKSPTELMRQTVQEWKALNETQKKRYIDASVQDLARYRTEAESIGLPQKTTQERGGKTR